MEGRGNARHCYVSLHYGVIHHSRADFGIIVSRGGFTKRAVDDQAGNVIQKHEQKGHFEQP